MIKTFKCSCCGITFKSEWSDKEALQEAKENNINTKYSDISCDDCYNFWITLGKPMNPEEKSE